MRPVSLFVRSAGRPRPALAAPPTGRRRRGLIGVGLLAVFAAATGAWVATSPRGVVLDPLIVHPSVAQPEMDATAALHAAVLAVQARAREGDDLPQPGDADWPPIVRDADAGVLASALRSLRRTLAGDASPRIATEVLAQPDHLEIVVRRRPGEATLRSRVARGSGALDRILVAGAEDVLLLATPLAAAGLLADGARVPADVARLDKVLPLLAGNPVTASDPRAVLLRGIDAAAAGRCDEALDFYERVVSTAPTVARASVLAAECEARLGKRERALARLEVAAKDPAATPRAQSLAGQAYLRIGDPGQGLPLLRAAFARDKALSTNHIAIGEALLALHRPGEALAWLAAHPPADDLRVRWLGALGLAQVRSGAGPAAQATAVTLRAGEPGSVEATRIEAELAAAMKAWPQALGRFGALRVAAPGDGAAHAGEGQALLGLRRTEDALAAYRRCVDVAPWQAECRLGLGIALREADRSDAALGALADAAKLDAVDPRIPLETARTLRGLLRRDEAAVQAAHAEHLAERLQQRIPPP